MSYALWKWTDFIQAKTWRLRPGTVRLLLQPAGGALLPGRVGLRAAGGRRQELLPLSRQLQLRAGGAPAVLRRQLLQRRAGEGPGGGGGPAGHQRAVSTVVTACEQHAMVGSVGTHLKFN